MSRAQKRLTEEEKQQRRHQRKADQLNARARAAAPLFADQVEQTSAEACRQLWLRKVSEGVERLCTNLVGNKLLDKILEAAIRNHVRQELGAEVYAKLDAYRWHVFPDDPAYGINFWRGVLSGTKRVELALRRVPDVERRPGQPAVVATDYWPPDGWRPTMTAAEFDAMFPSPTDPPEE